ncbi:hypothetical protein Tco_0711062 [Tanacetum coccineum]
MSYFQLGDEGAATTSKVVEAEPHSCSQLRSRRRHFRRPSLKEPKLNLTILTFEARLPSPSGPRKYASTLAPSYETPCFQSTYEKKQNLIFTHPEGNGPRGWREKEEHVSQEGPTNPFAQTNTYRSFIKENIDRVENADWGA